MRAQRADPLVVREQQLQKISKNRHFDDENIKNDFSIKILIPNDKNNQFFRARLRRASIQSHFFAL